MPQLTHRFIQPHRDCGLLDVEQSSETGCVKNGVHLAGFDSLIVWQNAFSIRSSTAVALSKHRKLFVISMPILILPSVSLNTLPGWRGSVSSTLPSSGLSVGLLPSNPHTLWWSRCSLRISTSVMDISFKGVPKCLVRPSYRPRHVWSCFFVAQCGRPDIPSIVTFKLCGFAFLCVRWSSPPYLVHYTSRRSAPSLDAHIFDLQRQVRCSCRDNKFWQLILRPFHPVSMELPPGYILFTFGNLELVTCLFKSYVHQVANIFIQLLWTIPASITCSSPAVYTLF